MPLSLVESAGVRRSPTGLCGGEKSIDILAELDGLLLDRPVAAFRVIPYFMRTHIELSPLDELLECQLCICANYKTAAIPILMSTSTMTTQAHSPMTKQGCRPKPTPTMTEDSHEFSRKECLY